MNQKEIKKWLETLAEYLEENYEEKITFRVGDCKCEYHKGNGEFTTIKGALFLTTHNGNLFTVRDDEKCIMDYFDIFGSNDTVTINEDYFTYVFPKNDKEIYKISLNQIKSDIEHIENEFKRMGGAWENNNGDYGCISIAEKELDLVKGVASRYPFFYQYDESEINKYSDYEEESFSMDDFKTNKVTEDNYNKADEVASDFKIELILMLEKLQKELEFLPPRFRQEFLEVICYCKQDAHSVKKNAELFLDNIMNELTEEENSKMFMVIK